jgi:hypothetical protein
MAALVIDLVANALVDNKLGLALSLSMPFIKRVMMALRIFCALGGVPGRIHASRTYLLKAGWLKGLPWESVNK